MMKVAIGCDHAGYPLKATVLRWLFAHGMEVMDMGTDSASAQVDYTDFAKPVALEVQKGYADIGVLMCGTGLGMSLTANKIPGIRCAVLTDSFSARAAREHNNANCIALGARVTGTGVIEEILEAFFSASFSEEERHRRRVAKLEELERDIARQYLEKELKDAKDILKERDKAAADTAKAASDAKQADDAKSADTPKAADTTEKADAPVNNGSGSTDTSTKKTD